MAAEPTSPAQPPQLPTAGSLAGILDVLETDDDFRALIAGEIEEPESDIDPSITVGVPDGLRRRSQPALRANSRSCSSSPPAAKLRKPWSPSVPGMTETQTMWRSLKHGRPFPMNGFHHARTLWQAAWRCSAG